MVSSKSYPPLVGVRDPWESENPQINGGFVRLPYASCLQEVIFEGVGNGRGGGI